jgi:hypothetical protein
VTIEEALVKLLKEAAGVDPADAARLAACHQVASIVAGRIYPKRAPQGERRAHIVYHRISGAREHSQDGPSGLARPRIQLDLWAPKYADVRTRADAVRVALDGFAGSIGEAPGAVNVNAVFLEDEDDDWDDDRELHMYRQDFTVWHNE